MTTQGKNILIATVRGQENTMAMVNSGQGMGHFHFGFQNKFDFGKIKRSVIVVVSIYSNQNHFGQISITLIIMRKSAATMTAKRS